MVRIAAEFFCIKKPGEFSKGDSTKDHSFHLIAVLVLNVIMFESMAVEQLECS